MIHLGTVVRLPVICIVVFASPSPEQVGISVHFLKLIFTERSDTTKIFLVWKSNGNKSQDIKSWTFVVKLILIKCVKIWNITNAFLSQNFDNHWIFNLIPQNGRYGASKIFHYLFIVLKISLFFIRSSHCFGLIFSMVWFVKYGPLPSVEAVYRHAQ
jgi:hypothetical protein